MVCVSMGLTEVRSAAVWWSPEIGNWVGSPILVFRFWRGRVEAGAGVGGVEAMRLKVRACRVDGAGLQRCMSRQRGCCCGCGCCGSAMSIVCVCRACFWIDSVQCCASTYRPRVTAMRNISPTHTFGPENHTKPVGDQGGTRVGVNNQS